MARSSRLGPKATPADRQRYWSGSRPTKTCGSARSSNSKQTTATRKEPTMKLQCLAYMMVLAGLSVSAQSPAPAAAKPKPAPAKAYTAPKTPWGDPDLQGNWPGSVNIPLQRPANMGERATLTEQEVAERDAASKKRVASGTWIEY